MSLLDFLRPQGAQAPGSMSQPRQSGLSLLMQPEVMATMAGQLLGNQGNQQNFGNALSLGGLAMGKQRETLEQKAKDNKTLAFFRAQAPEYAQMIDAGMPVKDAWETYTKQRYASASEVYGTPIYGEDPETGETVLGAIGRDGTFRKLDTGGVKMTPGVTFQNLGTSVQPFNTKSGAPVGGATPIDNAGQARDKEMGTSLGEQTAAAPSALQAAENSLALIQSLKEDPARGRGTGFSSIGNSIPATQGYGYQKKVDQAKAGAFLTSIQQLQGFGALSNSEGQVATAAVTRMDTAMSEDDFLAALEDYERIVQQGYQRAAARIGQQGGGAATPGAPSPQPAPQGGVVDYTDFF